MQVQCAHAHTTCDLSTHLQHLTSCIPKQQPAVWCSHTSYQSNEIHLQGSFACRKLRQMLATPWSFGGGVWLLRHRPTCKAKPAGCFARELTAQSTTSRTTTPKLAAHTPARPTTVQHTPSLQQLTPSPDVWPTSEAAQQTSTSLAPSTTPALSGPLPPPPSPTFNTIHQPAAQQGTHQHISVSHMSRSTGPRKLGLQLPHSRHNVGIRLQIDC